MFIVVSSHVDVNTIERIQKGEYVDFGKLIPRDRVLVEKDQRLEMIIRNSKTFYVPVSDTSAINSFARWEQAFRVYANIYTKVHQQRSAELIEYNHIIRTIALSYVWENVYLYDKDFHMHMARKCDTATILGAASQRPDMG